MADEETRPNEEPEVEGHVVRTEGPDEDRTELHDDEPDVEAHILRTEDRTEDRTE